MKKGKRATRGAASPRLPKQKRAGAAKRSTRTVAAKRGGKKLARRDLDAHTVRPAKRGSVAARKRTQRVALPARGKAKAAARRPSARTAAARTSASSKTSKVRALPATQVASRKSAASKGGKSRGQPAKANAKPMRRLAKTAKASAKRAPQDFDKGALRSIAAAKRAWEKNELAKTVGKMKPRRASFTTDSGIPIPELLTPLDRSEERYLDEIGLPGQYPFTRGPQPTMYRGRLWTMRQFAGFGTPEDTNARFRYLLSQGMHGLSTAFDMPALMGYDADHPMSRGEVGKEGVAASSLEDFETLYRDIPLDEVTTSMTINASAIYALACYVVVAEKQGIGPEKLGGTIQADILKEYIAQKEWIIPPRPAVRLVIDMIEWCAQHMPKWNPISISGYHIREAGATAVQELAFTLADGIGYVEESIKRGMKVDDFAPRLSFFWDVHNDFFEEVAKFRAARRIWARVMRDRFGAKDPRSLLLRTHAQTAGVSLTAQQPYNNVVRVALQAFAAVLGGTQSLHTNSLDETYALPTEESVTIALRTQQIIAHESGADRVVDPLGGSYYVEYLTDEMEKAALAYIEKIDEMGGIIRAVEEGFPQKEIAESAFRHQKEVESKERLIVGVNSFQSESEAKIELLKIDDELGRTQSEKLATLRATRDKARHAAALEALEAASRADENVMPAVLESVRAYATLGEVCDVFRKVFGTFREVGRF